MQDFLVVVLFWDFKNEYEPSTGGWSVGGGTMFQTEKNNIYKHSEVKGGRYI